MGPRPLSGVVVRPLNLTVRRPGEPPVRIRLSDFENTAVASAVPSAGLCGTAVRRVALTDWGDNWLLLQLDSPLEYHGQYHERVLVRSRWQGYDVGGPDATSVFVLLIPDAAVLDRPAHTSQDFEHVSWANATTLPVS
jgi:hypothetical protein